jgi:Ca2+-binding RTX toxin-like protein
VVLSTTGPQHTQEGDDSFTGIEGLIGSKFADAFGGTTGDDLLAGGGGNDTLLGGAGADTLQGNKGRDLITGSSGKDVLSGGTGVDTFRFALASNSTAANPDRITDLEAGDIIDLAGIDANTHLRGNQAFVLRDVHTGAGQAVLSYNAETDRTTLSLYVNAGDTVDGLITMNGDHSGHTSFVL